MIARDQPATFGARGTPNFSSTVVSSGRTAFRELQDGIDEEIKKAEGLLKKGTPKAKTTASLSKTENQGCGAR